MMIAISLKRKYFVFSNVLFYFVLSLAILGQPNGFFLYFPLYQLMAALAFCFFGVYTLLKLLTAKSWTLPNNNLWLPLVCFFSYAIFSLSYAENNLIGIRILFSMMFKVLIFAGILIYVKTTERVYSLLNFLSYVGTLFSVQALLLVFGVAIFKLQPMGGFSEVNIPGLPTYNFQLVSYGPLGFAKVYQTVGSILIPRAQGMFTEPGWFANFLEVSIFATFGCLALQIRPINRSINLRIAIQFLALFFSFSTAGWFSMVLGLTCYIFILAPKHRQRMVKFFFLLIILAVLLIAIVYIASPKILEQFYTIVWKEKFHVAWEGLSSANQRLESLRIAAELFAARPIGGWGISQMQVVSYASANNAFFTVAAELGIIGLLIYTTMISALIYTMFRNAHIAYRLRSPLLARLAAASTGCVIALITHSMFVETNWNFFYWIGIAFLYVTYQVCRSSFALWLNQNKALYD